MTEIDVTDKDAATAHVGDTLVVRLAETPSTGFTWIIDVTGTGVSVARSTQTGHPEPRPGRCGSAGVRPGRDSSPPSRCVVDPGPAMGRRIGERNEAYPRRRRAVIKAPSPATAVSATLCRARFDRHIHGEVA